jgi:hypothetical protein
MDLPRDLIELFSAFASAGVRYLLVGGHAVAAHGRPRSTKDVDLWLAPDAANIRRACRALAEFGAPEDIVRALRESGPEDIVWMGRAPTRIDLLRSLVLEPDARVVKTRRSSRCRSTWSGSVSFGDRARLITSAGRGVQGACGS